VSSENADRADGGPAEGSEAPSRDPPSEFDGPPSEFDGPAGPATATGPRGAAPDGFGTAGWVLAAAVFVLTIVIPGAIYLYPELLGTFGAAFFVTYLLLPLVPAVLLGLIAVWSMSAATN